MGHRAALLRSIVSPAAEPARVRRAASVHSGGAPSRWCRGLSPRAMATTGERFIRPGHRSGPAFLVLPLLIACGGGGGGPVVGGGGGGISLIVNVQPAVLAFAAPNTRETPPSQAVAVTVSGASAGALYFAVTAQGQAVAQVSDFVRTSSTEGYFNVTPQPASTLGIGTFSSLLTILACPDATCSSGPTANTPLTVNVTYGVAGVIVSPSSLAFTIDDQTPASASAGQLQISGVPQQRWTASTDVPWLSLSVTSGAMGGQLTATLLPDQTDSLQNQVYSGRITLVPDQGDPATVPVTLTVSRAVGGGGGGGGAAIGGGGGGISLSVSVQPAVLAFAAPNPRETPPSQALAVTVSGASTDALHFTVTPQGQAVAQVSDFVRTSSTEGYFTVTPQPASALGIGTFYSLLTVLACQDATCSSGPIANTPLDVNVTYSVAGIFVSPSSLAFTIDDQTPASASAGQLQISGAPQQRWTASTDVPWLSLSVTSGAMGDQLTATLVSAQTDPLQSAVYSGQITLVPDQGDPVMVPVALTVRRAQLETVAPCVAIAGRADEVILRGSGFGDLTLTGVRFGTEPATAFRKVSDTEIRATPPALAAGTYPVHLDDVEGIDRTLASLIVVDPPAYPAAALSYPTTVSKQVTALIYDAQRQAILVGLQSLSPSGSQVVRFAYGTSDWEGPTAVGAGRYPALALSTNGDTLFSSAGASILELDPVTLETRATLPTGGTWDHLAGFGVSNDGQVLAMSTWAPTGNDQTPLYRELVHSHTVEVLGQEFHLGQVGASADGARVFMGSTGSTSQLSEVLRYDASTGLLTGLGVNQDVTGLSVDRTGATLLAGKAVKAVFDGDLYQIGSLPTTTAAAVISPDGTRAYTYDQAKTLRTFDLTQDPVAGVFPEVGSPIPLVAAPDNKPTSVSMAITPDGGTVILAGSLQVIVQPVH